MIDMELTEELKEVIDNMKDSDSLTSIIVVSYVVKILTVLQDLCDGAGETQWTIKDQINIAIEELKK